MLYFILGIAVGLLLGWLIWARGHTGRHQAGHGHASHDHKAHDRAGDHRDEAGEATPLIDSGDAIAPTGVPRIPEAARSTEPEAETAEPEATIAADVPTSASLGDGAVETDRAETAPEPRAGLGTGPLIDAAAQDRARAIGITPARLGARGDDLKRIKGVGPKLETMLHGSGVYTFAQMSDWTEAEIDAVDADLTAFKGRIRRDDWRAQAKALAQG